TTRRRARPRSGRRFQGTSAAAPATRASSMASCALRLPAKPPSRATRRGRTAMADTTTQPIAQRFVGESVKRSEDVRILTGIGSYVDDIQLPGMLHAAFLRSPLAHARILSVDVSAARQLPGVVVAMTGEDVQGLLAPSAPSPGIFGPAPVKFTIVATDKVRLVGDPIAVVVAESRYLAEDALQLVEVEYDELVPVANTDQALDPTSTPIFEDLGSNVISAPTTNTFGDVAAAFAKADR